MYFSNFTKNGFPNSTKAEMNQGTLKDWKVTLNSSYTSTPFVVENCTLLSEYPKMFGIQMVKACWFLIVLVFDDFDQNHATYHLIFNWSD